MREKFHAAEFMWREFYSGKGYVKRETGREESCLWGQGQQNRSERQRDRQRKEKDGRWAWNIVKCPQEALLVSTAGDVSCQNHHHTPPRGQASTDA